MTERCKETQNLSSENIPASLWALVAVYFSASLIHFVHNAEFVNEYPNLPVWLTRSKVYFAWIAVTAVGALGVLLLQRDWKSAGLLVLAAYAILGFAGLDHYWAAPVSAHTMTMNLTIWFEAAAAFALLVWIVKPQQRNGEK